MSEPEEFWDKSAGNYDKTEQRFEHIHRKSRENARKHLKVGDVVLDYGCGTGTAACELANQVKEIHAIDISSKMVEAAKGKADARNLQNVSFLQADIFDERYKEESFDAILAFNILHTVPNPQDVVERFHEMLKPEGVFISVTPCLRGKMSFLVNLQIQFVRILCAVRIIPIPIRRLKSSELDDLIANGGFQAIYTEVIYSGASSYFIAAKKSGAGV
ncbi:class I SAM-dependent methyltransferase [Rubinisphaera italica]|uniref:Demethylrebeccamycin-D-glucose O-methyltransferase n=1 Tax=Rubinisphaera italica TaxID=2527969 RepID=A0A5C5XFL6_9PLAN|nr:class I SAM-dependent methyltransferase [Rubinisphaera italica]TWT60945.1 Demethylrebeccamycin-D-glucose O-methyltransferase [Rubinisphaera italica]